MRLEVPCAGLLPAVLQHTCNDVRCVYSERAVTAAPLLSWDNVHTCPFVRVVVRVDLRKLKNAPRNASPRIGLSVARNPRAMGLRSACLATLVAAASGAFEGFYCGEPTATNYVANPEPGECRALCRAPRLAPALVCARLSLCTLRCPGGQGPAHTCVRAAP